MKSLAIAITIAAIAAPLAEVHAADLASAAESFDFGILTGSAKSHSYGLAETTTVKFTVLGASKIWFAQMDYGGNYSVTSKVGDADAVSVGTGTVSTLGTVGNKKCTKSTLAEAITEGNITSVTYTGSEAALITVTGNQYLSRIWVEKYEAPSISITLDDFAASITKEFDLSSASTTATNTTTASLTGATGTPTIAYTSSHPAVATVESTSGVVTAVSIGTATITATATFEGAEAATKTYVVTVKKTTAVDNDVFDFRQALNSLSSSNSPTASFDLGVVSIEKMYYKSSQYGAWFSNGGKLNIKVTGACTIYVAQSNYSTTALTVSAVKTADASALEAKDVFAKIDTDNCLTIGDSTVTFTNQNAEGVYDGEASALSTATNKVVKFSYTGTDAATITFTGSDTSTYIPCIQVVKASE